MLLRAFESSPRPSRDQYADLASQTGMPVARVRRPVAVLRCARSTVRASPTVCAPSQIRQWFRRRRHRAKAESAHTASGGGPAAEPSHDPHDTARSGEPSHSAEAAPVAEESEGEAIPVPVIVSQPAVSPADAPLLMDDVGPIPSPAPFGVSASGDGLQWMDDALHNPDIDPIELILDGVDEPASACRKLVRAKPRLSPPPRRRKRRRTGRVTFRDGHEVLGSSAAGPGQALGDGDVASVPQPAIVGRGSGSGAMRTRRAVATHTSRPPWPARSRRSRRSVAVSSSSASSSLPSPLLSSSSVSPRGGGLLGRPLSPVPELLAPIDEDALLDAEDAASLLRGDDGTEWVTIDRLLRSEAASV